MTAQSPASYTLSALLHTAAVLLVLLVSYAANRSSEEPPKILELVAGEGDNYGAMAAPALGSPAGIKVPAPIPIEAYRPPAPEPALAQPPSSAAVEPAPVAPAPENPLTRAPPEKKRVAAKTAPVKPPDFVRDLKRIEKKREARLERKFKALQEAEEKRRLAREKLLREQEAKAAGRTSVVHVDAEGIREGVIGGSIDNKTGGAGGKALTREEGSELDAYYSELRSELKKAFDLLKPEDVSDTLTARVEFFVGADGSLSRARIVRASGNAAFDDAALQTFARVHSIGPKPDNRGELISTEFKMHEDDAE